MSKLADELRQPAHAWLVAVYRILFALLEGSLPEAELGVEAARTLGERAQRWNASVTYRLQLYLLRREQGRLDEVADLVRASVRAYPSYPIWSCVLAQMAAELGHTREAAGVLRAIAADGFSKLPFDEEWLVSMSLLAETAARVGDAERAAEIHERLRPYSDRIAVSLPEVSVGAVARYLGLTATTMMRWDDAERYLRSAQEIHARIGARPWLSRTSDDYARMLQARP